MIYGDTSQYSKLQIEKGKLFLTNNRSKQI